MKFGAIFLALFNCISGATCGAPCGGMYTQSQGEFFSPEYPSNYPNNAYCIWRLQSPRGQVVSLNFTFIDLEKDWDAIIVYDGPTEQDQHLHTVTGNQTASFISSSRHVTVIFYSDKSNNQKGFRAEWASIDGVPCEENLTQPQGELFSPNYPNNYPNEVYCVWKLQSLSGQVVSLNFTIVDLEMKSDEIYVYDGPTDQDQLLGIVTGNQRTSFTSISRYMTVVFRSDSSWTQKGFRAEWRFLGGAPCGGNLTQSQGEFYSPEYPNNYPSNTDCVWRLQSPEQQVVSLIFTFVDLEMESDVICVYDGPTYKDQRLGIMTGNQTSSFTSSSRYMTVFFRSDSSLTQQGFRAEWRFLGGAPCGGNLTQSYGEFFSPNYPNNYPNKAYCVWTLQSPEQQVVSLIFTFVDLESHWDSVDVYDGLTDEDPHLGAVTENQTTSFISSSSHMTVIFSSDESKNQKGFQAEWAFLDTEPTQTPQ